MRCSTTFLRRLHWPCVWVKQVLANWTAHQAMTGGSKNVGLKDEFGGGMQILPQGPLFSRHEYGCSQRNEFARDVWGLPRK